MVFTSEIEIDDEHLKVLLDYDNGYDLDDEYFNMADKQEIEREGIRIYNENIGQRLPEFTLVDNPTMDDPTGNSLLKSSDWMKQENDDLYNFVQV